MIKILGMQRLIKRAFSANDKRNYPEISFLVTYIYHISRYDKATEVDYAEYIYGCGEERVLILSPKSL